MAPRVGSKMKVEKRPTVTVTALTTRHQTPKQAKMVARHRCLWCFAYGCLPCVLLPSTACWWSAQGRLASSQGLDWRKQLGHVFMAWERWSTQLLQQREQGLLPGWSVVGCWECFVQAFVHRRWACCLDSRWLQAWCLRLPCRQPVNPGLKVARPI